MHAELCSRLPCDTITPRGVAVDPDVYCKNAGVSGRAPGSRHSWADAASTVSVASQRSPAERRVLSAQRFRPRAQARRGERELSLCVADDGGQARQMAGKPCRKDRHGNGVGEQASPKSGDEIEPRREKEHSPLARRAFAHQARRDRARLPFQFRVGEAPSFGLPIY